MEESGVYNPLTEDFSFKYDISGTKNPQTFIIPALDIAYFPIIIAEHMKKHLANKILHIRGVETNWRDDYKKVLEEISK